MQGAQFGKIFVNLSLGLQIYSTANFSELLRIEELFDIYRVYTKEWNGFKS